MSFKFRNMWCKHKRKLLFSELCVSVILCITMIVTPGELFNVDTEFPIVIRSKKADVNVQRESLFGASVLLLESRAGRSENDSTGWVLIGAPRANSSHPNYAGIKEPGVVWRCSLGRQPLNSNDCEVVQFDPLGNFDPSKPQYMFLDAKDSGWLGGSMDMGKSVLVACASRWSNQKFKDNTGLRPLLVNGMCYWLPKSHLQSDLTNDTWPWAGDYTERLMPLLRPVLAGRGIINAWDDVSNAPKWDNALAGHSVHITDDDRIVLGAPGVNFYKGSFIQYASPKSIPRYFSSIEDPKLPDDNVQYFGYTTTSGKFFHNRTQYAAGAPRGGSLGGRVYIFTLGEPSDSVPKVGGLVVISELKGEEVVMGKETSQLYSYFGATIAAADVNGDGFDDLLVGAPMFAYERDENADDYGHQKGPTGLAKGEEGCVFVYQSDGVGNLTLSTRLYGDQFPGSRFGLAINSLGDINDDGFRDIAIGAPYENGVGAVYIYRGSSDGLVLTQKLKPFNVKEPLKGFGFAVARGVDIDGNRYPDVAVGSHMSEAVVIYRVIPVVQTKGRVQFPLKELWADLREFNISSCVSYDGTSLPEYLPFNATLRIISSEHQLPLLSWTDSNPNGTQVFSRTSDVLTFKADFARTETCYNFTVVKLREPEAKDGMNFIIVQEYTLEKDPEPKETRPISYEIDSSKLPPAVDFGRSEADFDEFERKLPLPSFPGTRNTTGIFPLSNMCHIGGNHPCEPNITISAVFRTNGVVVSETDSYIIGSTEQVTLYFVLVNIGEVANLPINIILNWTGLISVYDTRKPDSIHFKSINVKLERPLLGGANESLGFVLKTTELYCGETHDNIDFITTVTSAAPMNTKTGTIKLPVSCQFAVSFDTSAGAEVEIQSDSLAEKFQHEYKVSINGPSPLHKLQLSFQVPFALNTSHGLFKFLNLEPVQGRYLGSTIPCGILRESLSDLQSARNLADDEKQLFTKFRWSRIFPWKLTPAEREARRRHISCATANITCAQIICEPMEHFTPVYLANYVINMELLERNLGIFDDFTALIIETEAQAIVLDNRNGSQLAENGTAVATTEFVVPVLSEVPAWVIVASVAGGVILLILTVVILAKCGFFRREKRDIIRRILETDSQDGKVDFPED